MEIAVTRTPYNILHVNDILSPSILGLGAGNYALTLLLGIAGRVHNAREKYHSCWHDFYRAKATR